MTIKELSGGKLLLEHSPMWGSTEKPFYTSISTKIVATGSLNPEEEIELKPQISGIVDAILVKEGDMVFGMDKFKSGSAKGMNIDKDSTFSGQTSK